MARVNWLTQKTPKLEQKSVTYLLYNMSCSQFCIQLPKSLYGGINVHTQHAILMAVFQVKLG